MTRIFLGDDRRIPLPGVTGSVAILRYLHFTVVINSGRRLAHYAAYNCDASQLAEVPRRADNWLADPLVPESLQMNLPLLTWVFVPPQLIEAVGWVRAPQYLIRDRDRAYDEVFARRVRTMGMRDRPTTPRSPWQNGHAERLIG